jgi:hypothetical protein
VLEHQVRRVVIAFRSERPHEQRVRETRQQPCLAVQRPERHGIVGLPWAQELGDDE